MRGKEVEVSKCGSDDELQLVSGMAPEGFRVLVVDDDPICLRVIKEKLTLCKYQVMDQVSLVSINTGTSGVPVTTETSLHVTTCQHARVALSILREKKDKFNLILTDVHMPDMNGFELLELVGLELDLPVIMMSADREPTVAARGLKHGACYYLMKPICVKELCNIWQHAVRWKKDEHPKETRDQGGSAKDRKHKKAIVQGVERHPSIKTKRKKDDMEGDKEDEEEENEDSANHKKKRLVWSAELHSQFLKAIEELGFDKAVPKTIRAIMNVPGITRANVASHLQKYRLYIRRLNDSNLSLSTPPDSSSSNPTIESFAPQLTFGVQDQMAHDELSDQYGQMVPQPGRPGNMQGFSMMAYLMSNPPLMDGTTNFQQSHLQQLMEELSLGYGTSPNQMTMNQPSLYNESAQMTHQQEESQSELLGNCQLDDLNMPNVQGHSDHSTAVDGGLYGLMVDADNGLHGLTLSDPVVEPSNGINMNDFLNSDFSAFQDDYANKEAASSGAFPNDNQKLESLAEPVQEQNDFTWGHFLSAADDNSFLLDVANSPPFCANSPFSPQFDEAYTGDLLSKQQPGAAHLGETNFDISLFHADSDDGVH